jgi:hypothetical protein
MPTERSDSRAMVPYEPSPRELLTKIDSVNDLLREKSEAFSRAVEIIGLKEKLDAALKLAEERDRWYSERDKDRQVQVDKALTAAKEQTASSFAASKEAILKAEEAQRSYNQTHNDLNRKMEEQNKATMPRPEIESRFSSQEEKIGGTNKSVNELRESREKNEGRSLGVNASWAIMAAVVGVVFGAIVAGATVALLFKH